MVVALATPFLIELMTVLFVDGVAAAVVVTFLEVDAAAVLVVGRPTFRTTVDVLASLDSLIPLILLAFRDAAAAADREAGVAAVAPLPRVREAVVPLPPADELAVDEVVGFRVVAARVARAFSTMELRRLEVDGCFVGDIGLAINDLAGDGGAAAVRSRSRGLSRELDDAGDRT